MIKVHDNIIKKLGEDYILEKGALWIKVTSQNMMPLIHVDDSILVTSIKRGEINLGDIILFRRGMSPFIAHWIIGKRKVNGVMQLLEKGDSNSMATWIPVTAVIAKVVKIKRKGKSIINLDTNSTKF